MTAACGVPRVPRKSVTMSIQTRFRSNLFHGGHRDRLGGGSRHLCPGFCLKMFKSNSYARPRVREVRLICTALKYVLTPGPYLKNVSHGGHRH